MGSESLLFASVLLSTRCPGSAWLTGTTVTEGREKAAGMGIAIATAAGGGPGGGG